MVLLSALSERFSGLHYEGFFLGGPVIREYSKRSFPVFSSWKVDDLVLQQFVFYLIPQSLSTKFKPVISQQPKPYPRDDDISSNSVTVRDNRNVQILRLVDFKGHLGFQPY